MFILIATLAVEGTNGTKQDKELGEEEHGMGYSRTDRRGKSGSETGLEIRK